MCVQRQEIFGWRGRQRQGLRRKFRHLEMILAKSDRVDR
jgi:hypothetical protein